MECCNALNFKEHCFWCYERTKLIESQVSDLKTSTTGPMRRQDLLKYQRYHVSVLC
jgi:hypothetical protein